MGIFYEHMVYGTIVNVNHLCELTLSRLKKRLRVNSVSGLCSFHSINHDVIYEHATYGAK